MNTETSTEFMQRFLRLAGFLGAAAGTKEEQAKNFQWGLRRRVVIGISRPLSRVVTGTTVIITTVMGQTGEVVVTTITAATTTLAVTTGISVMGVTRETWVSSPTDLPILVLSSYPVCTTYGRRHPGECRRAAGTCFKCGQAGHLQKDYKKNTTASTSGQADKKPGASGRVFAITEGHAANTSGMDWLTEHHATIDCRLYRVIFGDIDAHEFIYHGSLPGKSMQIISALQVRTLLSHG
nr:hypothetical protein [Tanacetum cinerariifolium]